MATTISTAAQPSPTTAPQAGASFVDMSTGKPTSTATQFMQQQYNLTKGMSRNIPCNCASSNNVYTLSMLSAQPTYTGYAAHDQFGFVADTTSTGTVTANVVTSTGALETLPVHVSNGASQAGANSIVAGGQYFATYVDSLNGGAGGFVLR
ncbi:hypothetical protein [Bradyrhizobium sp. dw_78]|uniref:hypothetical protein n=1 Tax=Bradyrhizobium sp. dw_78 TaxID=2719793 RepID=UPI001BD32987|nr:hypothetical protein [Bradyrhizobium sp. dw_78]